MNAEDFKALRVPLVLLVIMIIAAGAAIYHTNMLREKADLAFKQQQAQLREAQTRMQRSGDEKTIIVQYVDKYRQLEQAGIIGDEQRIDWLDSLRVANQRTDLFGINYSIGIQQPYPFAAELDPGQISLRQSLMKLEFRLLHEMDLLRFFQILRTQGGGLFHLDSCVMRRTELTGGLRFQPNIAATCELAWITASPVTVPGGKP